MGDAMTMVQIDVANNLFSIILSILLIVGILVGAVAWFIRLESKVLFHNEKIVAIDILVEQRRLEQKVQAEKMWDKLNEVLASVTRVEERLASRGS